jgi:Flp pilus assembly protein TadG
MLRLRISRRGAAALELAVVLPVLLFLVLVSLDFARVYQASLILDTAAASGAAHASGTISVPGAPRTSNDAAIDAVVAEGARLSVALTREQVSVTRNSVATVHVQYDYPLLTGFLVPGGTVSIERTVIVPIAPRPGD